MRLMFLFHMLPRFAGLMSSRTSGGMLSALTSRVGNVPYVRTLAIGSHSLNVNTRTGKNKYA